MTELSVREKVLKAELQNIACDLDLDPETAGFLDIVNAIFALKHPWVDVDGTQNMPLGKWIVVMADGERGVCEVVEAQTGKLGLINDRFYFDFPPVVAYMPMPEYINKGGNVL